MLKYIEEVKKYVDEMIVWDGKIRMAKNTLRRKAKTVSSQELEILKNMVKGSVAFKLRSYIELCAYFDRNNVFYGKQILSALPGYKGEGYALVAEKWQKDILTKYIRRNTPMTKNIADLVDISKLFENSTHKTWTHTMIRSPYSYENIQGRYPSCWDLIVDENYVDLLKDQVISPERMEQLILDGKCVLLNDLYTEDGQKIINKKYIFDMAMDCVGNSVYEKMYPNLRSNFWELYNERTKQLLNQEILDRKNGIKKDSEAIKQSERNIERHKDDILKLNEILEK